MRLLPLAVALAGLSGCIHYTKVGRLEVDESTWQEAQRQVAPRASFDLNCPEEQLKATLLDVDPVHDPSQLGIEGCGKRSVYVKTYSGWVLNAQTDEAHATGG